MNTVIYETKLEEAYENLLSFNQKSSIKMVNFDLIRKTKQEVFNKYKENDFPWVIGYEAGRNSFALLQFIFEILHLSPRKSLNKTVYVLFSNTHLENPVLGKEITDSLFRISNAAKEFQLPIEIVELKPEQNFLINLIGKGFPAPNEKLTWCSDRLKLDPVAKFFTQLLENHEKVIWVSSSDHHASMPGVENYFPLREWTTDDFWDYLLQFPNAWGDDPYHILERYETLQPKILPLLIEEEVKEATGVCANTTFDSPIPCWICTKKPKNEGLIQMINQRNERGLIPLLELKNWLSEMNLLPENRDQNGSFSIETRKKILERFLAVQEKCPEYTIITQEEVDEIYSIWNESEKPLL